MARRLGAAARRNAASRASELHRALAADATGRLARFTDILGESSFSSNVTADKIIAFDECEELLDVRRVRMHQAGGDRRAVLASLRSSQWFARREAFEALWQHGRRLIYGAVNAGNMGTEGRFGGFCLIVAEPADCAPSALAVFPNDTAQGYTTESGTADLTAALADTTRWEDRAVLAVRKHAVEAVVVAQEEWADLICAPNRYLETVITPAPLTAITEVRLRTTARDRIEALELRHLAGDVLSPAERNELDALLTVRRWARKYGFATTGW